MNYQDTLQWLFSQLPMYQRIGNAAYKADLNNTNLLMSKLNAPQEGFKSIHVAGTNGKGSTSHMLASVLQEAGYTVGLYTSPHLKDFRERIKINGEMIPKQFVTEFVTMHRLFFETHQLSFFEMTVGMAFDYFRNKKVDIAIIEVGLGGRLDSTNVILPEVSVITNIGLDHTKFLGTTLREIASEKAGIIKTNIPVVIGETTPETKLVFEKVSEEKNAPIIFSEEQNHSQYQTDLLGRYQEKNQRTVVTTLSILIEKGWQISGSAITRGLLNVVRNTGLMGRYQILNLVPKVVCDTAHNKEGLAIVLEQISEEQYDKLHMVLGVVDDKDLDGMLPMFPVHATYYFCKPDVPRGLAVAYLAEKAAKYQLKGSVYKSVLDAYNAALQNASENDLIYIGGSTFVVAEVV
ncbi:bifunctional folylpolyglutamate synthase/dihydrofolate synthase [Cochleicola gelatinilyticus]|uniref:Dihydrofolate synthase/folylpolyglutamate synthase n=1 Tax=Cochleicola gelatinilyticus TaxID=1763537 RepID=A0A167IHD9_9FLAO|nr:folylpolyglutamate synthase/dihydrofolate synthase family protein [Cochleicola gelatinilyticus]OAB79654.1 tetrahydrofolate synthase [Cochleicola gelatinilyticus]